ncbi:MAG: CHAT domain-containing protein [Planctomycetes bacterium]|nr:CHAT domain-containing protein [Planctomycetota bacterium]
MCIALWMSLLASFARLAQAPTADHRSEVAVALADPPWSRSEAEHPLRITADFRGTLHVWCASNEADPLVRVETADGRVLAEDDDSGGGTTAYLALDVVPGEELSIRVASRAGSGTATLAWSASTETDATRAQAEAATNALAEAIELKQAGDKDRARKLVDEAVAGLLAVDGVESSARAALAFPALGLEARALGAYETAGLAFEIWWRHSERVLPEEHPVLTAARYRHACTLYNRQQYPEAKVVYEQVVAVRERTLAEDDVDLQEARESLGSTLVVLGELARARPLLERALDFRTRTLPADDVRLASSRCDMALLVFRLGESASAVAMCDRALEGIRDSLPEDDQQKQYIREVLAVCLRTAGDLSRARTLGEENLASRLRTLREDDERVLFVKLELAAALHYLGDLHAARALQESVVAVRERTLPADHPALLIAKGNLASTRRDMGDLRGALALNTFIAACFEAKYPEDKWEVQTAHLAVAGALHDLGRLDEAIAILERLVASCARTFPVEHEFLQKARINLAAALSDRGDHARARVILEESVPVLDRSLPAENLDVLRARCNLGAELMRMGDNAGARALLEPVVQTCSRTLPADHPFRLTSELDLASAAWTLGDAAAAAVLLRQVLDTLQTSVAEDHPLRLAVRTNLGATLLEEKDLVGARAVQEDVVAILERRAEERRGALALARANLAGTLLRQGDEAGARRLYEVVLADSSGNDEYGSRVAQLARRGVERSIARRFAREPARTDVDAQSDRERRRELALVDVRALRTAAERAILASSGREAEERAIPGDQLADAVSAALGDGVFAPDPTLVTEAFLLSETTRNLALYSARLAASARNDPARAELWDEVREHTAALATLVSKGAPTDDFTAARSALEESQRKLVLLGEQSNADLVATLRIDAAAARHRLDTRTAFVGYRRINLERTTALERVGEHHLCAFVARADREPALVDLGPMEPVEQAVKDWRAALGGGAARGLSAGTERTSDSEAQGAMNSAGERLRRLVVDPLRAPCAGAERWIVALDDVLNLVPLDALPAGEPWSRASDGKERAPASDGTAALLGDRVRIDTTLNLFIGVAPEAAASTQVADLVALGDAAFDFAGSRVAPQDAASAVAAHAAAVDPLVRGGSFDAGFGVLPATRGEVVAIGRCFESAFGAESHARVLLRADASSENLASSAPSARWLHVATHGWFAPDWIQSTSRTNAADAGPAAGLETSLSDAARGMRPMLLCGLALAGANAPVNTVGRTPGLITAEEIGALDLSHCELAVLSACDTNVGLARAGQGVASLQKALHIAGARSVITSVWKVPDEATRELMVDFYRRLWVEKKPKWQALWEAKKQLRDAKDTRGKPLYTTRDWAAWVLTGDPE